jgi:hypothetical protein
MDMTVTGIGSVVVEELRGGWLHGVEERGSTYTPSLGVAFASMTVSPRTGRFSAQRRFDYGRLVSVFDSYVSTGRVDLSCRKRGVGGAQPLPRSTRHPNDSPRTSSKPSTASDSPPDR